MEMNDKRLWRIVLHYVKAAMNRLDLSSLKAFSLAETKSRKGHRYVTVFINLDRVDKSVVFAVAGKGKQTLESFKKHLSAHGGKAEQIIEVVSDMSAAFIAGVKAHFPNSSHTVDWFMWCNCSPRRWMRSDAPRLRKHSFPNPPDGRP